MSRIEKISRRENDERKVVKFRSGVTFKMESVIKELNSLAKYVNASDDCRNINSAFMSILFKMSNPNSF